MAKYRIIIDFEAKEIGDEIRLVRALKSIVLYMLGGRLITVIIDERK